MPMSTRRQAQARSHPANNGSPAIETPTAQTATRNGSDIVPVDQDMEDEVQDGEEEEEAQGGRAFS